MHRRKSLLALIGTVILLVSLSVPMMQCAPEAVEEEGEEAVVEEEEGEIEYGGRLSVGWRRGQGIETLRCDYTWKYTAMGCQFWPLIYDQLWILGPAPGYEALPGLASSWETEDGKTWTFHLCDNAVFHDGVPVTAEDVAFTIEYLPQADPCWCLPDRLTEPGSIQVIDGYTIEFTLQIALGRPYPPAHSVPILPKHIWEAYKDNMASFANDEAIGSGPFKLKEFKPAEHIWFEANEDYWAGRPYVDEIVYKVYGSEDALYAAIKSGDVDMVGYSGVTPPAAEDFKQAEHVDVIVSPGIGITWLSFNLYKDTPLQDLDVRKAIMYGVDKARIMDMVYLGYAEKQDSFIYPEVPEYNANLPQYDYDPDMADELLNNGNYVDTDGDGIRNDPATGDNLVFELMAPSTSIAAIKTSTLIKEQLVDIGISIDAKTIDFGTFQQYIYTPKEGLYEIAITGEEPGPVAEWVWEFGRSYEAGGAGWNTAYYNNARFDELLDKMTAERDVAKRIEYVHEMQMILAEDLPYAFLCRVDVIDPVSDRFEGWVQSMGGISSWINQWTFSEVHLKKQG